MEIVELFVQGKLDNPQVCEDRLMQNPHYVAVIDGVSDRSGRLYGHRKGGRLAADVVQRALHLLDPAASAFEAAEAMTKAMTGALAGYDYDYSADRPGASVVVYSHSRREIWSIGDCSFRIDDQVVQGGKAVDDAMLGFRRALIAACLAAGETVEEISASPLTWEALLPVLVRQHHLANSSDVEFGYGVINGRPVPERFVGVFPVGDASEVVLASDGYPQLLATLALSEQYLAEDLARDPLRVGRHPGFRPLAPGAVSFDDRAYIRISI